MASVVPSHYDAPDLSSAMEQMRFPSESPEQEAERDDSTREHSLSPTMNQCVPVECTSSSGASYPSTSSSVSVDPCGAAEPLNGEVPASIEDLPPMTSLVASTASCYVDDQHVYTNLKEMAELSCRPCPRAPCITDIPRRQLNNGWVEYETEAGRTFFFNADTGKSQWIPPRFIRTPAEVQAMLRATREDLDDICGRASCSSSSPSEDESIGSVGPHVLPSMNHSVLTSDDEQKVSSISEESGLEHHYEVPETQPSRPQPTLVTKSPQLSRVAPPPPKDSKPPLVPEVFDEARLAQAPPMMSSFTTTDNHFESMVQSVTTNTRQLHHGSPATSRASTKSRNPLMNVPLPQVLPSSTSNHTFDRTLPREPSEDSGEERLRHNSEETREGVRTIKSGMMHKVAVDSSEAARSKKREWISNFMYLTSAHLIIYKDERSAEKHNNHFSPPLGVFDLRGAHVSWNIDKEKKKRSTIQLELPAGCRYLLRTSSETDTTEWFDALRDVISRLPSVTPTAHALPIHPGILDSSCAVVRNPSSLSQKRPHSTATLHNNRSLRKGDSSVMWQSVVEGPSDREENRPSRDTILERLRRFFRTRPSVESLKAKGIYKCESVFGSTLAQISQVEKNYVPKFIRVVTELIEAKGLEVDGLYRVSGNLSSVQRLRCQIDQDKYENMAGEDDVHVLTGSLKLFFRELAEPLFPPSSHKDFLGAIQLQNAKQRFKRFDELLKALPMENKETLKMLLRHLHRVAAHSAKNRMQAHNLAIMFGPTLFHSVDDREAKKKDHRKKTNKKQSVTEESTPNQSNSKLAFAMIMQGRAVEYLLEQHSRFEALQGPLAIKPPA